MTDTIGTTGPLPRPRVMPLPGWRDPLEVLPLFAPDPCPALLLSAEPGAGALAGPAAAGASPASAAGHDAARFSFLCAEPFGQVTWDARRDAGDPFDLLERALAPHRREPAEGWPFAGGAIGWIGFDARLAVEPCLRPTARTPGPADPRVPDVWFGLYGWAIAWDHHRGVWAIVATGAPDTGAAAAARAEADLARVARRLQQTPVTAPPEPPAPADAPLAPIRGTSLSREAYLAMVESARDLIAQGELYQVNLAQRLRLDAPRDPMALMRSLRRHSPAPFSAWVDTGEVQVACASPERFVSLRGARAETRPIKGTAPRGDTPAQDERLRAGLLASAKDRAENVMIVDLERNDLGRVCRPGTVRVEALCRLESYASVHHLVSIVSGELEAGRTRADLLRAMFPGGSMTGAPKVRALRAIDDLEPAPRGIYAGALGYLSLCGGMDLNIVIRTLVLAGGHAWLHAGGGIVTDSDPASEHAESLHKAHSVRRALGAAAGPGGQAGQGAGDEAAG